MKNSHNIIQLDEILNEEINNYLNEGYVFENENFKFKNKIERPSFYNYSTFSNDYDVDVSESDIYVNWQVGFWLNNFGIENLIINIINVEGTYNVKLYDKQSDELAQESDKNINEIQWQFVTENAILREGKTLYVESADFDFNTKECIISFYETE